MNLIYSYAKNPFNSIFKWVVLFFSCGLSLIIPLFFYSYKIIDSITSPIRNFLDNLIQSTKNEDGDLDEYLIEQINSRLPSIKYCSSQGSKEYYINEALDFALKIHDSEKKQQMMTIITAYK